MRLRIKFLVVCLLVGLSVAVYMDRVWIRDATDKSDAERFEQLSARMPCLADQIAAVWTDSGLEGIRGLVQAVALARDDLVLFAVLDTSGEPLLVHAPPAMPTPRPQTLPQASPDVEVLSQPLIHRKKTLGTLQIRISRTLSVTPEQRRWEGAFLIWFVLLVGVFWLIFERYINYPLTRLARATWALASGNYKVKLPRVHRDEMGSLIMSFRTMREAIQKRESEMLATNERMQSIFDRAVDGIFMTDHSGLIEAINPSGLRMFGCAKGQGEGENIDYFISGLRERIESGDFYAEESAEQGGYPVLIMDGTRRDGVGFSIELGISRLTQGNKVKYLGVFRDATKRLKMDQQLAGYTSELEAQNVLLDHTITDIASLSQAKTSFLTGLSEELRTPLNALLGMLTLLQRGQNLTPNQTELLNTAISSGNALITMMNDAFDFSKMDTASRDLESIDFDLRRVIEDTRAIYERIAVGKDIDISSVITASVPELVRGDPTRFRQILNNLLSNAVRYTDRGEVVIRCEKIAEEGEEMTFEIQVSDTGQGMTKKKRDAVLATAARPIPESVSPAKISGMGLPIANRLVDMFGGEIGMSSEEGVGTTLWFTIQLQKTTRERIHSAPLQNISGVRVLYVDDNPTSLGIMERILEIRGVYCATVRTAEEGINELRRANNTDTPFDLVFIDRMMPGIDGIEMGRRLAEDETLSKIKRVLLTSISVRGDGQLAREAGFHGYFTKPLNQNQIYDCVATVLGLAELSAPLLVTRHTLREQSSCQARVLLVEDNIVNQKVALGLLAKLNVSADLATNGKEAVDAVFTKRYDAVLMDCEMPVMSGYEATRRIRKREHQENLSRLPIIALTAHAAVGYQEKCREVGMDDHIAKPVRKEMLELALSEWIKNFPQGG